MTSATRSFALQLVMAGLMVCSLSTDVATVTAILPWLLNSTCSLNLNAASARMCPVANGVATRIVMSGVACATDERPNIARPSEHTRILLCIGASPLVSAHEYHGLRATIGRN